jgi:nucleoid DNA-binding protein
MTKADIVNEISEKTGIEKLQVQHTVEAFMTSVKSSLSQGSNVYLRGWKLHREETRSKNWANYFQEYNHRYS